MSAKPHLILLFFFLVISLPQIGKAQNYTIIGQSGQRVPQTALPALQISPDARASGMGETGLATHPTAFSTFWNPAKMTLLNERFHVGYSFTPWLPVVMNDMFIQHAAVVVKPGRKSAIGVLLTRFNLGDIQIISPTGSLLSLEKPYEELMQISYARTLGAKWSLGASAKYITFEHFALSGPSSDAEYALAADLGVFYQNNILILNKDAHLNLGLSLTNLGPKVVYMGKEQFLPASLKLGTALELPLGSHHLLTLALDLNKPLVPSQPLYARDNADRIILSSNGKPVIASGKDPDRPWLSGTFGSWADAPDGFKEELREIIVSTGLEYSYRGLAFVRTGYFHEAEDKGGRQHLTAGLGGRYKFVGLDVSYIYSPRSRYFAGIRPSLLHGTFRFSLLLQLGRV